MSAESIIAKRQKRIEFSEKLEAIRAKLAIHDDNSLSTEIVMLLQKTYNDFDKARLAAGIAAGALNGVSAVISSYEKNPVEEVLVHAKFFAEKQASLIKESVDELG